MTWNLQKSMYREVAQTLQEARKSARAVETVATSLAPLSDGSELSDLKVLEQMGIDAAKILMKLYNGVAVRAFGGQEAPPDGERGQRH